MSLKSLEATLERKTASVRLLEHKYHTLRAFKHAPLSKVDLQTLGISLSRLDLQNQQTPFETGELQFFQPLPLSSIKRVPPTNERALKYRGTSMFGGAAPQSDQNLREFVRSADKEPGREEICKWKATYSIELFQNPQSTPPFSIPQKFIDGMHEFHIPEFNNTPYEWCGTQAYDTCDPEYPHQVMRSWHALKLSEDVEATVLRSEMMHLITTILSRMDNRTLIEHEKYPVLIASSCHFKTRFIQGYFDGETLRVAFSDFVDHKPPGKHRDLMLRWLLSDPVGDTKKSPQDATSIKSK